MRIIQADLKWNGELQPLDIDKLKFIVLHHDDWIGGTVTAIHEDHIYSRNWKGIAYNEWIDKSGNVYICRGDNIGGHVKDLNDVSYGICCNGNYDIEEMPTAQLLAATERVKYHKARFAPAVEVVKHSKLCDTSCPGFKFPMMKIFNGAVMPVLHIGAHGEDVSFMQRCLQNQGYELGNVDGDFGVKTDKAVRQFQMDHDLKADGKVGILTWGRLMKR